MKVKEGNIVKFYDCFLSEIRNGKVIKTNKGLFRNRVWIECNGYLYKVFKNKILEIL